MSDSSILYSTNSVERNGFKINYRVDFQTGRVWITVWKTVNDTIYSLCTETQIEKIQQGLDQVVDKAITDLSLRIKGIEIKDTIENPSFRRKIN